MKSNVPLRHYTMGIRLTTQERLYLEREASERQQRLSDYVRDVLLATMNFKQSVGENKA